MKITRIFEDLQGCESAGNLSQDSFVELLARHKALLLRNDDGDPWDVNDFAKTIESLQLARYEYVGGAGKHISSIRSANDSPLHAHMFSLAVCVI